MLGLFKRLPDKVLVSMSGGTPVTIAGRTLDPMVQFIAAQGAKNPPMSSLTPNEARQGMDEAFSITQNSLHGLASIEDRLIPGPRGDIAVRVYTPKDGTGPYPILQYMHQGGCVIGGLDSCHGFCTMLADVAACIVVSVEYRLAPEHPFPAAAEDAVAAYMWLRKHGDDWGGNVERMVVAGDSAGGGLSSVITHTLKREGLPQPLCQVLIYPWVDAAMDTQSYTDFGEAYPLDKAAMEWFGSHYLTSPEDVSDTRVSPLRETDFTELAPALVYTAGFDPLHDEGEAYAEKLREAGVDVSYRSFDSLCHAFTALGGAVPAAHTALVDIAEDIRAKLH
ncbi:MAG: esterase [Candidatus Hydrogenedentota bacterium]|nr:MAG: esterase [Candidatus Hydrogenedentota bacterium]